MMSTAALQHVWSTILSFDLSAENKRWLAEHLWEQADMEEVRPYTVDELCAMARAGRAQIAHGEYYTTQEVLDICADRHD